MDVRLEVDRLLKLLGNCPDEVAAALGRKDMKGVRNTVRFLNPVVRYVQECIKDEMLYMDVATPGSLTIRSRPSSTQTVALPEAVEQFMHFFNQGRYSGLEVKDSDVACIPSRNHSVA